MQPPFVNLVAAVWERRGLLALSALVCGALAAGASLLATPIFKAVVVVSELYDRDSAKRAKAGVTGGVVAALANFSDYDPLGNLTANARAQQFLRSGELAEQFVRRYELIPQLFPNESRPVSVWMAARRFRERVLYVYEDRLKGTTAVYIEWPNAQVAARWATDYVALANEMLREQDLATAQRKLVYLAGEARRADELYARHYLYEQIAEEMETVMWARGRPEYEFTVIDPARPPGLRVRPPRTLMTTLGATAGLLGALVAVFARVSFGGRARGGVRSADAESGAC
jgi:uncharacterized protein involved in exopolysaccharide biosynthesis